MAGPGPGRLPAPAPAPSRPRSEALGAGDRLGPPSAGAAGPAAEAAALPAADPVPASPAAAERGREPAEPPIFPSWSTPWVSALAMSSPHPHTPALSIDLIELALKPR